MESIVERVKIEIDRTMKDLSDTGKAKLEDVRSSFEQFFQLLNSPKDIRIELFCQQLDRLLNNNNSFSIRFWIELYQDILHILGKNDNPQKTAFGGSFRKRMEFEKELKQRKLKCDGKLQKRKNLQDFLNEHEQFFKVYFENCISFHSKLQVENLFEDMAKFSEDFVNVENWINLQEKLKCINIEYDCTDRILYKFSCDRLRDNYSSENVIADITNYLPSKDQSNIDGQKSHVVLADLLKQHRWIVILADPGNSKTTLLRWLTYRFAEAAENGCNRVNFKVDQQRSVTIRVRIPILIRIGEFATWLEQDRTKTLIDYIGEHTWFSKRYCFDEKNGQILRELISQGHALILLDGLDEVANGQQIPDIVRCVKNFIKDYVQSSDFISAFDEKFLGNISPFNEVIETKLPKKSAGNQIIITSRLINYRFSSIIGPFIQHSLLPLIKHEDAKLLVHTWTKQISKSIINILKKENISFDENKIEEQSQKRNNVTEQIFKEKFKLLSSNSTLLFLISKLMFQSTEIHSLKCRADIYRHAVEKELCSWRKYNENISQDTITYFLINLAFYLHLESSSGLIDGFNIERLCCLILNQKNESTNRKELLDHTESIISWLKSNVGIGTERALNVYSFLHLSFQEYFVAMGFTDLTRFSSDDIVRRMVSFTIHSRFRESLLLAMGLISWKLSLEEYDQFCTSLFTRTMNNSSIPFGILLFFDSISDLYKLPSKKLLFQALNQLFNHSCYSFSKKYFMSSLLKLSETLIKDFIYLHIQDEKSLVKISKLFLIEYDTYSNETSSFNSKKYRPSIIYETLSLLYNSNLSKEFFIDTDQILRRTIRTSYVRVFKKDFNSDSTYSSDTHPLIISVLCGLIGDIQYFLEETTVDFKNLFQYIPLQSSILKLIKLDYFDITDQSDVIRIDNLIEKFKHKLNISKPTDISLDIIEIFIGLICLQGVSQPLIYKEYAHYKALPLALDKFKQIWFYFKQYFTRNNLRDSDRMSFMSINFGRKSILESFSSNPKNVNIDYQSFAIACASAWKKFGLYDGRNQHRNFSFESRSDFIHLPPDEILANIDENIHVNKNPRSFLPQSMQKLVSYLQLPPIVFLSQCLINFENVNKANSYFFLTFPMLFRLLEDNILENYTLLLFHEEYAHSTHLTEEQMNFYDVMKNKDLFKDFFNNEIEDYDKLISIERECIKKSQDDTQLFAASICLARIFQAQHRICKDKLYEQINLNRDKNQEIISSIRKISNSILQIIAWSIILDMKDPFIFDGEQINNLKNEIYHLLKDLKSNNSIILLTFLFIQCYTIYQFFPEDFQQMRDIIGKKLIENPQNDQQRLEQEATYIALKKLNNSDLSYYLIEFEKQTKNLSDLLFNSTIFHQYLSITKSSKLLHRNLLSSMYFVELAFDCQILRMFTEINQKNIIDLKQLWKNSSKTEKIMTYGAAVWINSYLQTSDKQDIEEIIVNVSQCIKIERKALSIIEQWLEYRKDKNLQFFAHYSALQLVINDSTIPELADIFNEMLVINKKLFKKSFEQLSFYSLLINSNTFGKLLIDLKKTNLFLSMINMSIDLQQQDLLKIILDLEYERITSEVSRQTRSVLLIIKSISKDLQEYLIEHLKQQIIDINITKQQYIIAIIKCLIEISMCYRNKQNYPEKLYDYILSTIFYNQQIPQIQKVILNSLYSVFLYNLIGKQEIVLLIKISIFLEEIICSWTKYEEDVLNTALLVYGNYLLCFEGAQMNEDISKALENILKRPFDRQFIRASICFMAVKNSRRDYDLIFTNFFDIQKDAYNKETKYRILLELTLYQFNEWSPVNKEIDDESIDSHSYHLNETIDTKDKICDYLDEYSDEILPMFIDDLYDFLCKNNDSSDLTHINFIDIALQFIEKNSTKFLKAIRKRIPDEKKFRTQLKSYYERNPNNRKISIKLYASFRVLTSEFLCMIEQFYNDNYDDEYNRLSFEFEQVSDRLAIEELFQLIQSADITDEKFHMYSIILSSIVRYNQISLCEIHQRIKLVNNDSSDYHREEQILNLLLECSCIDNSYRKTMEIKLVTENDIEQAYRSYIEDIDKNYNLFSRGNYHWNEV